MCPIFLLLGAVSATALALPEEPANLVANGDFSQVRDGKPESWATSGSVVDVSQTLTVERDPDGQPFARLACSRCDRQGGDSHAMLAQNGHVSLRQGRLYTFSCRLRAKDLASRTINVAIQETRGWLPTGLYTDFTVGPAWQKRRATFFAARDVGPTGRLQIWFSEPGTLDVADVSMVETEVQSIEFTEVIPATTSKNLVPNGSFELSGAGWSSTGTGVGWGDLDDLHGTIEPGGTHGDRFLRIPLGDERTPVLCFDYFEPQARRQLRVLSANLGWIPVEKGAAYTISCDMRASVAGVQALLGARAQNPTDGRSNSYLLPVELTTAWHRYAHTFRPEQEWVFVCVGPDLTEEQRVDVDIDAIQLEKHSQATSFAPRTTWEFAVEASRRGGIFVAGEPCTLLLRLCNHAATPAEVNVNFETFDYFDKPVALPPASLTVPPHMSCTHEVPLPADWRGYYHLRAVARSGEESSAGELRVAIVPPPTVKDSVCGINHAFVSADQIQLACRAGVTWYRDWSLKWQHIEPVRGEFHWELGDVQIDRVLRAGGHVLPLLPPFPSADWNSEAPDSVQGGRGYPANRLRAAFAPQDPRELAGFIGKAVERYQDRVRIWEFLNEPIFTSYALPGDRGDRRGGKHYTPADYVALLEVAAKSMRVADPTCRVIGGIAGGARTWTREVIEAGCLDHVDLFNLHIYPGRREPESYVPEMQELLAMMDARGGRKPIWITEFSYYGADNLPRRPFLPRPDNWSEERLLESERQCADYAVRFFLVMLAQGVEKVFLHSGSSGRVNSPNFECALFDYGSTPRKLLPALAILTDLLGERPECVGLAPLGDSGHAAAFETGRHALVALWSEGDGAGPRIDVPLGKDMSVVDIVGRPVDGESLVLSSSPVYLLGSPGQAKQVLESVRENP